MYFSEIISIIIVRRTNITFPIGFTILLKHIGMIIMDFLNNIEHLPRDNIDNLSLQKKIFRFYNVCIYICMYTYVYVCICIYVIYVYK